MDANANEWAVGFHGIGAAPNQQLAVQQIVQHGLVAGQR
jgi:hypothetical protein